jgi:ketosteroid isomerase-like protein
MKHPQLIIYLLVVLPLFFCCKSDMDKKSNQTQKNPKQMTVTVDSLKQALEAFNRHDLEAIMGYFADDCILDMPRGPDPFGKRYVGKAQVREALAGRFKGIPDVHYGEDVHWVAGDRGVSEWLLSGTSTAGVKIKVRGCDLWQFRDGKIIRKDSYWKIVEQ